MTLARDWKRPGRPVAGVMGGWGQPGLEVEAAGAMGTGRGAAAGTSTKGAVAAGAAMAAAEEPEGPSTIGFLQETRRLARGAPGREVGHEVAGDWAGGGGAGWRGEGGAHVSSSSSMTIIRRRCREEGEEAGGGGAEAAGAGSGPWGGWLPWAGWKGGAAADRGWLGAGLTEHMGPEDGWGGGDWKAPADRLGGPGEAGAELTPPADEGEGGPHAGAAAGVGLAASAVSGAMERSRTLIRTVWEPTLKDRGRCCRLGSPSGLRTKATR